MSEASHKKSSNKSKLHPKQMFDSKKQIPGDPNGKSQFVLSAVSERSKSKSPVSSALDRKNKKSSSSRSRPSSFFYPLPENSAGTSSSAPSSLEEKRKSKEKNSPKVVEGILIEFDGVSNNFKKTSKPNKRQVSSQIDALSLFDGSIASQPLPLPITDPNYR